MDSRSFIEQKLKESSGPRRRALQRRGLALQKSGERYVRERVEIYVAAVRERISSGDRPLKLLPKQEKAICEKILRRVRHLTTLLTHQKSLERLSQAWVGAPVPEFWEDEASVARFFDGFCYDIVTKLNALKSVPEIVQHVAQQFNIRGDDDEATCQRKIERFFDQGKSWAPNNWPPLKEEGSRFIVEHAPDTAVPEKHEDDEIPF
jgi:hypothetical protein